MVHAFTQLMLLVLLLISTTFVSPHPPSLGQKRATEDTPHVTPARITSVLAPTQRTSAQLQVRMDPIPARTADIMFVFDRGGLNGDFDHIKSAAIQTMHAIRAQVPNAQFGVGSFAVYPAGLTNTGYVGKYGGVSNVSWELNQQLTDSAAGIIGAINQLTATASGAWPQAYARALYEVMGVQWRARARKLVILFGDAPAHDRNFAEHGLGSDSGQDGPIQAGDDVNFATAVQQASAQGISIIATSSRPSHEAAPFLKSSSINATVHNADVRYFQHSTALHMATAAVQFMRKAPTEERDMLRVTAGYERWVKIIRSRRVYRGTSPTRIFELTIAPPKGTAPGFYPFIIEAFDDRSPLGRTYVDITVPAPSASTDLGFRPDRDGFRFANMNSDQSWDMFKQFFGAEQVEHANGTRIYAADVFYHQRYRSTGGNGSCSGLSATSLINYMRLPQPSAGRFAMPHTELPLYQAGATVPWEAIAFAQGLQQGLELQSHRNTMCYLLGNSPSAFYRYIKAEIAAGRPAVLGIFWDKDYAIGQKLVLAAGGGHSLVPYRYEEPAPDRALLYVYDSNTPGDNNRRIEFDLAAGTWTYQWVVESGETIDLAGAGTSNTCTMSVTPLDMYTHQGVAPWAQTGAQLDGNRPHITPMQVFVVSGPARLIFTGDNGQLLGETSRVYYMPVGVPYQLKLQGSGEGRADVSVWGEGYLVQLTDLLVTSETTVSLSIPTDGSQIAVTGVDGEARGSLSVSRVFAGEDRTATARQLAIHPGEELVLELSSGDSPAVASVVTLRTNGLVSRSYDLALQQSGDNGYAAFEHAGLILDARSDTHIAIDNWSQLAEAVVTVDRHGDGSIEATRVLANQARPAAISSAAPHSASAAGEQIDS